MGQRLRCSGRPRPRRRVGTNGGVHRGVRTRGYLDAASGRFSGEHWKLAYAEKAAFLKWSELVNVSGAWTATGAMSFCWSAEARLWRLFSPRQSRLRISAIAAGAIRWLMLDRRRVLGPGFVGCGSTSVHPGDRRSLVGIIVKIGRFPADKEVGRLPIFQRVNFIVLSKPHLPKTRAQSLWPQVQGAKIESAANTPPWIFSCSA